jgi:hypothetical protein
MFTARLTLIVAGLMAAFGLASSPTAAAAATTPAPPPAPRHICL